MPPPESLAQLGGRHGWVANGVRHLHYLHTQLLAAHYGCISGSRTLMT